MKDWDWRQGLGLLRGWADAAETGPGAAGQGRGGSSTAARRVTPRKSAIFAGEEFFLIGPHGDIRAIFKEA